jgi:hypothetical protein
MRHKFINATHIIRVTVRDKQRNNRFNWHEAILPKSGNFFGFGEVKGRSAGWYEYISTPYEEKYMLDTLGRHRFKIDYSGEPNGIIVEKPRVEVETIGGKYTNTEYTWFDTYEEALESAKSIAEEFPHIILIENDNS